MSGVRDDTDTRDPDLSVSSRTEPPHCCATYRSQPGRVAASGDKPATVSLRQAHLGLLRIRQIS